jgi:hypothetical protein
MSAFAKAIQAFDVDRVSQWKTAPPDDAWLALTGLIWHVGRGRGDTPASNLERAEKLVRIFIERRWGLDAPEGSQMAGPLEEALSGHCMWAAIALIEAGAKVRTSRGNAVDWALESGFAEGLDDMWKLVAPTAEELTSERFHWACSPSFGAPIGPLLAKHIGIQGRGYAGLTPLHYAALGLDLEGAKELIQLGADTQARTTASAKVRPRWYPASGFMSLPSKSTPLSMMDRWRSKQATPQVVAMENLLREHQGAGEAKPTGLDLTGLRDANDNARRAAFQGALSAIAPAKAGSALKTALRVETAVDALALCERGDLPANLEAICWKWLSDNKYHFPADVALRVGEALGKKERAEAEVRKNSSISDLAQRALKDAREVIQVTTLRLLREDDDPVLKARGLTRAGGGLAGVSAARWPEWEGKRMKLVLVVDAEDAPSLPRTRGAAVAIFARDEAINEASRPHSQQTAVLWLTEEELEASRSAKEGRAIAVEHVEVPNNVWTGRKPELSSLRKKLLSSPGRVGGEPLWLQGREYNGNFVLQVDTRLISMNLGDDGILYVFADTAFWQCL